MGFLVDDMEEARKELESGGFELLGASQISEGRMATCLNSFSILQWSISMFDSHS